MATLTQAFRTESQKIHAEHTEILAELEALERSLEHLGRNDAAPKEVLDLGRRLLRELPAHCRHEEETLHGTVGEVSPELAQFCALMREEHDAMRARLWSFANGLDRLEAAREDAAAIANMQREGRVFVQQLRRHIQLEERELSGFL